MPKHLYHISCSLAFPALLLAAGAAGAKTWPPQHLHALHSYSHISSCFDLFFHQTCLLISEVVKLNF